MQGLKHYEEEGQGQASQESSSQAEEEAKEEAEEEAKEEAKEEGREAKRFKSSNAKQMRCIWDNLNLCKKVIFWTVFGSNNLKSLVMQRSKGCPCAYCCKPDTPWCLPLECERMKTLRRDCEDVGIRFKVVKVGRNGRDEAGNRLKGREAKEINSVLINVDADIVWCCKWDTDDEDDYRSTYSTLPGRFFFGVTFEDMEANGDVISLKLQTIFVQALPRHLYILQA